VTVAPTVATTRSSVGWSASRGQPGVRPRVDERGIRALARELGRVARTPTRIYLTGGSTAVIEGWRETTIDVDLRFEPEAEEVLRALPALKERLGVNIELVSPPDFIPELPGWRERSPLVYREGRVDVHQFDLYSQALSKIERGFEQDLADVRTMISRGLVEPPRLRELYEAIEPELYRYPAIDPPAFRQQVESSLHG
jgi:hypothetical protein